MLRIAILTLATLHACTTTVLHPSETALRLNQIQAKGTHNSYHLRPSLLLSKEWNYSHATLDRQLGAGGVRQFELDVHLAPESGWTVFHVPNLDTGTTCAKLRDCLATLRQWSDQNRNHHAIFIFIEPKDDYDQHKIVGHYEDLEEEILSEWPRSRIITPDQVRGDAPTLRDAITRRGWPSIEASRGRALFVMLDQGEHRQAYADGRPSLQGRLMFVTSDEHRPDAAIIKIDDPIRGMNRILAAVSAGFIVRTRADSKGLEPLRNDRRRMHAALRSGAHLISTDFPMQVPEIDYWLELPGGSPSRTNPVTAPPDQRGQPIKEHREDRQRP